MVSGNTESKLNYFCHQTYSGIFEQSALTDHPSSSSKLRANGKLVKKSLGVLK